MSISPSVRVHRFALALCSAVTLAAVSLLMPASAGAYATPGPAPVPGSPGLPDGRIYELVSPANKPGTEAANAYEERAGAIWAAADGDAVGFSTSGPVGDAASGVSEYSVARRSGTGWKSFGATPLALVSEDIQQSETKGIGFSADFTKSLFAAVAGFVPGESTYPPLADYVYGIGTGPIAWLQEPLNSDEGSCPREITSEHPDGGWVDGASTDLSTVYFSLGGAFCEWHEGQVSDAGVLPNGSLSPYGAMPAGFVYPAAEEQIRGIKPSANLQEMQNQVSEDGSKAFFVSPSPGGFATEPPQLYVRETDADGAQRTVLISRDTLLPPVEGLPAPAPHGALAYFATDLYAISPTDIALADYVWATPNGSRAFFVSTDRLTPQAPADESGKLYEFNLETEALTYLSGAAGPTVNGEPGAAAVLAASQAGSSVLFAKLAHEPTGGYHYEAPTELDLWTDGPEGPADGHVTPIATLDPPEKTEQPIRNARAAGDGSAFVFETKEAFPGFGFNNGDGTLWQVYRYEVATNSLTCISCDPAGMTTSSLGNAHLTSQAAGLNNLETSYSEDRGISENGDRVFFDTPEPLVPWDANAAPPRLGYAQGYNVYEWEGGKLFLISTGKSDRNSFVGDNSANGNNVFFSTAEGLVPGDTDGGYDVYDARIPEPGEETASAVPCEGEVCQGPPSTPSLLGAPASATFSGLGNPAAPAPAIAAKPTAKSLTNAQKLAAALKACKRQPKKARAKCEARARKKYAPKAKRSSRRNK